MRGGAIRGPSVGRASDLQPCAVRRARGARGLGAALCCSRCHVAASTILIGQVCFGLFNSDFMLKWLSERGQAHLMGTEAGLVLMMKDPAAYMPFMTCDEDEDEEPSAPKAAAQPAAQSVEMEEDDDEDFFDVDTDEEVQQEEGMEGQEVDDYLDAEEGEQQQEEEGATISKSDLAARRKSHVAAPLDSQSPFETLLVGGDAAPEAPVELPEGLEELAAIFGFLPVAAQVSIFRGGPPSLFRLKRLKVPVPKHAHMLQLTLKEPPSAMHDPTLLTGADRRIFDAVACPDFEFEKEQFLLGSGGH